MGIDLIHPRCLVKDFGLNAFYIYRIGTLCFVLLLLVAATIVQVIYYLRRLRSPKLRHGSTESAVAVEKSRGKSDLTVADHTEFAQVSPEPVTTPFPSPLCPLHSFRTPPSPVSTPALRSPLSPAISWDQLASIHRCWMPPPTPLRPAARQTIIFSSFASSSWRMAGQLLINHNPASPESAIGLVLATMLLVMQVHHAWL